MTKQQTKHIDMLEPKAPTKKCFVIAPFGEENTPKRKNFEQLLEYVIEPVAKPLGFQVLHSLDIYQPGNITNQILKHLLEDDLVIADLTGHNPNVFYELAVRHCYKKPVIHIIEHDQIIPFHVASDRTIYINRSDWESVFNSRKCLEQQILSTEKSPEAIDNPIFRGIDFPSPKNPSMETSQSEVVAYLQDLSLSIKDIQSQLKQKNVEVTFVSPDRSGLAGLRHPSEKPTSKMQEALDRNMQSLLDSLATDFRSTVSPST